VDSLRAIDFGKLRRSYFEATRGDRLSSTDREAERQLDAAFDAEKWDEVVKLADVILKANFTRARAHVMKAYAQNKLGQDPRFHATAGHGLVESILATGDGRSPETAYPVFFIEEEYDVLKHERLRKERQDLIEMEGRHFDLISAQDASGNKVDVWFDITEYYGRLGDLFK
jgi:hypothetical protein